MEFRILSESYRQYLSSTLYVVHKPKMSEYLQVTTEKKQRRL